MNFSQALSSERLQRYQWWYGAALFTFLLLLNALVNTTSVIMEHSRNGADMPYQLWEPFTWELSSMMGSLILIPAIAWILRHGGLSWQKPSYSTLIFVATLLGFSASHVFIMVSLRKWIYQLYGSHYQFGELPYEFFYELRKDTVAFLLITVMIYGYRFIVSRLIAEGKLVGEGEDDHSTQTTPCDRILVKKMGKEFIVKLADVEWMAASGNYVNLHVKDRIYPVRHTLGMFIQTIEDQGFCRIHRSHGVNLECVDSIESLPSGDGEVKLKSGQRLNISRRYKDRLKERLL